MQKILHDPKNGKMGDCWRACVCSLLEISDDNVPNFGEYSREDWWKKFVNWATKNDYAVYEGTFPSCHWEYFIVCGPVPGRETDDHAVIGKLDENKDIIIVHDPSLFHVGVSKPYYTYVYLEKIQ